MIILAKNGEKALLMRDGTIPFVIAKISDTSAKVGDTVESYKGGVNGYFTTIEQAVLAFNGIDYNWDTIECIMDDIDISDYGIFECSCCGETKSIDDLCTEHNDRYDNICIECCNQCQSRQMYWDEIDREVDDFLMGK